MSDSRWVRKVPMLISAALRNIPESGQRLVLIELSPSTPVTPRASTMLWVSRNGTFSGTLKVRPWRTQRLSRPGTHLVEETVQIDMHGITSLSIE
jgi:hypothetical protein